MCDVGVRLVCQGLAPLNGGDPDVLVSAVLASPPEDDVHDGLVESLPWGACVLEDLEGELGPALLLAVPAQGSVQGPALECFSEEVRVANGGRREERVLWVRGGRRGGLLRFGASTSMFGWSWAGVAGLGGARWSRA